MLLEELLWVIALGSIPAYHAMVTAIPQLTRKITLGTQCDHKIHFGYDVKVEFGKCISWRLNGNLHRTDGPAVEWVYGDIEYYFNGELHRTDGPAIEYANGYRKYYLDGKLYRIDGPAVECANGDKYWYLNDKLYRIDGPAIEYADGYKVYYLNNIKYTLQEYQLRVARL